MGNNKKKISPFVTKDHNINTEKHAGFSLRVPLQYNQDLIRFDKVDSFWDNENAQTIIQLTFYTLATGNSEIKFGIDMPDLFKINAVDELPEEEES